jgi:hypothetical protein
MLSLMNIFAANKHPSPFSPQTNILLHFRQAHAASWPFPFMDLLPPPCSFP